MNRKASITRETKETSIKAEINLDGSGKLEGTNPIPFFEHMLSHLARYSMIDIKMDIKGDTQIDGHHTVEDCAIVLGEAIKNALGEKRGIYRFGNFTLPMDEVLTLVAVDFSGRPYFSYSGPDLVVMGKLGEYDSELTAEFWQKFSVSAGANIHIKVMSGENRHHIHESIFKAAGMAVRNAITIDERRGADIPSTKGII